MKSLHAVFWGLASCLVIQAGKADTVTFDEFQQLGSFRSDGLVRLDSIGTWNGQPVSDSNRPSDFERQLASTINFFASPAQPNVLWLQVTEVTTTHFGYAFGGAFVNITQTGIRFSLPLNGGGTLATPSLSLNYANPGQLRAFAPPDHSTEPLSTTPGYGIIAGGQNEFSIQTVNGADYGFINANWLISGSGSRILGGGVFQMTFAGVDVIEEIDFSNALIEARYGIGNQYIIATSVPEPRASLFLISFVIMTRLWKLRPGTLLKSPSTSLP